MSGLVSMGRIGQVNGTVAGQTQAHDAVGERQMAESGPLLFEAVMASRAKAAC